MVDGVQQLHSEVHADARLYHTLREEAAMLDHVLELLADYRSQRQKGGSLACQTWTLPAGGQSVSLFSAARKNSNENAASPNLASSDKQRCIRADDDSECRQGSITLSRTQSTFESRNVALGMAALFFIFNKKSYCMSFFEGFECFANFLSSSNFFVNQLEFN